VEVRLPLETDRLVIRPLRLEDAGDLHELYSDAEAMRFLAGDVPSTLEESRAWVQAKIHLFGRDGGMSLWAVAERSSGRVVGDAGLQWEEIEGRRELDLGCRLVPRHQGRGYATEASGAILRAAFHAGFHRVTAQTDLGNAAARRALERLGFASEGTTEWSDRTMAFYVCRQPGMSGADVLEVLDALQGLRLWLDGGWGVDALLGEQTRPHRDLDFALDERDLPAVERRLRQLGYEEVEEGWVGRPTRVVFTDAGGRWLDVHPVRFDDAGDGWQTLPGRRRGAYPARELVSGAVAGRRVPCISAALQRLHHGGYTLAAHDRVDLARLSGALGSFTAGPRAC
jgi:lincosamide nucleotidyltransferase A/C/D/E